MIEPDIWNQRKTDIAKRDALISQLVAALDGLADVYLANRDTEHEFLAMIGGPHGRENYPEHWTKAIEALRVAKERIE